MHVVRIVVTKTDKSQPVCATHIADNTNTQSLTQISYLNNIPS